MFTKDVACTDIEASPQEGATRTHRGEPVKRSSKLQQFGVMMRGLHVRLHP